MANGDLYKVIDHQTLLGETLMNVYWYEQTAGNGGAAELAQEFFEDVITAMLPLQGNSLLHVRLDVINTDNPLDYIEMAITANNQGAVTGEAMPPFVAFGFRLNRGSRDVRHGHKRIAGVAETTQSGGGIAAGYVDEANAVAAAMEATITDEGTSSTWVPRIVRKTGVEPNATYTPFPISSAQYVAISSQNSRKY